MSCGCYRTRVFIENNTEHGHAKRNYTTPEWRAWSAMKQRCYGSSNKHYKDYGLRGINVCERWRSSFVNFLEDMGPKPTRLHSLERIKNNGDYEPANCRWGTDEIQARNKRSNVWIEYKGERLILADWAKKLQIHQSTIGSHLRKGKTFKEAIEYLEAKRGVILL